MSGGSFNYLCYKDFEDIWKAKNDLQDMASELTACGAHGAAKETERVIALMEHSERQISVRMERLKAVWKAMEWWRSCDWSEDSFREEVAHYDGAGLAQKKRK